VARRAPHRHRDDYGHGRRLGGNSWSRGQAPDGAGHGSWRLGDGVAAAWSAGAVSGGSLSRGRTCSKRFWRLI
jgi:hypothetical protein